jgi:hypothetical protein
MDLSTIVPTAAGLLHVTPATLVFWLFVINVAARGLARRIPNDATGFWGFVRQSAAIVGVEVANRVTNDVTVNDVAKAAVTTPPIKQKVEADTGATVPPAA